MEEKERVEALTAALTRAIGEFMQDNPVNRPMAIAIGVQDGLSFASLMGGGANIDAPIFDRVIVSMASDLAYSRGGVEYTGSNAYKTIDDAVTATDEHMRTDSLNAKDGPLKRSPAWPFPTGSKK